MKPVADSLPLEPAIKLIQNVVVSPDSGQNNGHLISPFCKWIRVFWVLSFILMYVLLVMIVD